MSVVNPNHTTSLLGDNLVPHVDQESVDEFMDLIKAGVVPSAPMKCQAVQNNVTMSKGTRSSL